MDDVTDLSYQCPFCDTTKPTEKRVRQHIDEKMDNNHRGHGYDTDRTIETVYEGELVPSNTSRSMHDKIAKAARMINNGEVDEVEELDNDGIKKLAEKAGTDKSHVVRVLKEEDIEYSWRGRINTHPDTLTEKQIDTLRIYDEKGRPDIPDFEDNSHDKTELSIIGELTRESEYSNNNTSGVKDTIEQYSWMLEYDGEEILGEQTSGHEGKEKTEGSVDVSEAVGRISGGDEVVADGSSERHETFSAPDMEDSRSPSVDLSGLSEVDVEALEAYSAMVDAGVDVQFEVIINEDQFEVVKKLIKAGHEELAEQVNEGAYMG